MILLIGIIVVAAGGLAGWLLVRRHEERVRKEAKAEWRASHSRQTVEEEERVLSALRDPYLEKAIAEIEQAQADRDRFWPR